MEQFYIVPIPEGIELAPKPIDGTVRALRYESSNFSVDDINRFANDLCRDSVAKVSFQKPTITQWFRGHAHASYICEGSAK